MDHQQTRNTFFPRKKVKEENRHHNEHRHHGHLTNASITITIKVFIKMNPIIKVVQENKRSFWNEGKRSCSTLEEKMTFVEEKKKKLSELQTPNLEEERRKRAEKKLFFLNSKLERLSKQKAGEKDCENKDSINSSPKNGSSETPKRKEGKRLENLKLKKQLLEIGRSSPFFFRLQFRQ